MGIKTFRPITPSLRFKTTLTNDELNAKFTAAVEPLLGAARTAHIAERVWAIEEIADVGTLLPLTLDPERFVRIHRNCLVARDRLAALTRSSDGRVFAQLSGVAAPLEVSRRNLPGLRKLVRHL